MKQTEFDSHAKTYRNVHRENIGISGEEPEYFATYKMSDFKALTLDIGLPLDGHYLDFGSGIGTSIAPFYAHLPDAHLTCADISTESLAISRSRHGTNAKYSVIEGNTLPFRDSEFDGAFACCVFHHIPREHQGHALSELRRVLKPGGLLMIYEHNPYNPVTVRTVRNCPFDENAVLIRPSTLIHRCEQAGFTNRRRDFRVFFPAILAKLRPLEDKMRWLPLGAQYFVAVQA